MSVDLEPLIDQLRKMGFRTRVGSWAPFGEPLPLVGGVAWDTATAQLALIAEDASQFGLEEWRQLLFAGSALRHHLRGDGPAAFGSPVVLAIVDDDGAKRLRELAEDLARDYVLFHRVDLNLIPRAALDSPDELKQALAPLLPHCRALLGKEISRGEILRFWENLSTAIDDAAVALPEMYGAARHGAAAEAKQWLIGDSAELPPLAAPSPIGSVSIRNFRSFAEADVDLASATIISGQNGSGKSTLIEALELLWAGTSQRKPSDVSPSEYGRHLPTDGDGTYLVRAGDHDVTSIAERPQADLGRSVMSHDSLAAIVARAPEERYLALLSVTGLEVPNLKTKTGNFLDLAKREADGALRKAGLAALPTKSAHGHNHLLAALRGSIDGLPSDHDVVGAERALSEATGGAYTHRGWRSNAAATDALERVATAADQVLGGIADVELEQPITDAIEAIEHLMDDRREVSRSLRRLDSALNTPNPGLSVETKSPVAPAQGGIETDMAARWLAHSNSISDAATYYRTSAEAVSDERWSARLRAYADALDVAANAAPRAELQKLSVRRSVAPPVSVHPVPQNLDSAFTAAGFDRVLAQATVAPSLRILIDAIDAYGQALAGIVGQLRQHPAVRFAKHAPEVLQAISRYELARKLRREGPIMTASEQLVTTLLTDRLAPAVRELVAAMVRFEWYFKPLAMPVAGRKVVFGAMATKREDLDARLVLNAAEGAALGIAWFLALHMLQPAERRRVLVLDDPVSLFDGVNLGAFVSTLRAFVRLTRPDQVVIATHDDVVAAMLAEELSPVGDWPRDVSLLRCERDRDDRSVVRRLPTPSSPLGFEREIEQLALEHELA